MSTPILTLQKNALVSLIGGMLEANGYNFNWVTVNSLNLAISGFPKAEVYRPKEDNLDSLSGLGSNDYTNRVSWRIRVTGEIPFSSTNPVFDVEDIFAKCLDDLKMLFGKTVNRSVNGTMDSFLYNGYEHVYQSVDQFIPTVLLTKWLGVYSQDRATPTVYAGS